MDKDEVALPTIYGYCAQVYEAMVQEASTESLGPQYGDEEGLVYDGFTTRLIQDLGLPSPYYTKVFGELQRMDCVRQLRRGGSTTTSRWLLVQEPTPTLFQKMQPTHKQRGSKAEQQAQQINDLSNRLNKVEEALGLR